MNGVPFSERIAVENVSDGAGYLPRQWARLEIDRLLAEDSNKNKQAIIDLSKASYVMSPHTSLLVLESEADYVRFKVDRGRKDHWAAYDAPSRIASVGARRALEDRAGTCFGQGTYAIAKRCSRPCWCARRRNSSPAAAVCSPGFRSLPAVCPLTICRGLIRACFSRSKAAASVTTVISGPTWATRQPQWKVCFGPCRNRTRSIRRRPCKRIRAILPVCHPPDSIPSAASSCRCAAGQFSDDALPGQRHALLFDLRRQRLPGSHESHLDLSAASHELCRARPDRPYSVCSAGDGAIHGHESDEHDPLCHALLPDGHDAIQHLDRDERHGRNDAAGRDGLRRYPYQNLYANMYANPYQSISAPPAPATSTLFSDAFLNRGKGARLAGLFQVNDDFGPWDVDGTLAEVPISLLYKRPTLNLDQRLFSDLTLYAPALNTSDADIQTVLEAELKVEGDRLPASGPIEPAARSLIDRARSDDWKYLHLGKQRININGAGQFSSDTVLPSGLRQHVVCDGKTLLHVYPDIGLAARGP